MPWQPTTFLRFEEMLDTSMGTARIVTDAGPAYIKALGNRQGPHYLANELVATQLAGWFGLPTFPFALIQIDTEVDEIPFIRGGKAASGMAFVTQATAGHPWGGSAEELEKLVNPEMISRLVLFDTWVRNCDRHPPDLATRKPNYDNVFLADASEQGEGASRLMAMDHTHCFVSSGDLGGRVARIDWVKDDRLYGLFPAFVPKVREDEVSTGIARLRELNQGTVEDIVNGIPADWEVPAAGKRALVELICRRAEFVAENALDRIGRACWPERLRKPVVVPTTRSKASTACWARAAVVGDRAVKTESENGH